MSFLSRPRCALAFQGQLLGQRVGILLGFWLTNGTEWSNRPQDNRPQVSLLKGSLEVEYRGCIIGLPLTFTLQNTLPVRGCLVSPSRPSKGGSYFEYSALIWLVKSTTITFHTIFHCLLDGAKLATGARRQHHHYLTKGSLDFIEQYHNKQSISHEASG